MTEFISNREIYERVIRDAVSKARQRLCIATAGIKDMYVETGGSDMDPFLKVLAQLIGRSVEIRLIHAKEPGPNFREDFDRYPRLFTATWQYTDTTVPSILPHSVPVYCLLGSQYTATTKRRLGDELTSPRGPCQV